MSPKNQTCYIPFRCSTEMKERIEMLAAQKRRPQSVILRELVEAGMMATGATINESHLYGVVMAAVEEVARPSVERLAAISAKATQIDAANFFMYLYALTRDGSPEEQAKIQEAVESARRLGIQYLKLKDRDLDRFISEGSKQIIDKN